MTSTDEAANEGTSTELEVRDTAATEVAQPRRRRVKHDWELIRASYVEGLNKKDAENDEDRSWYNFEQIAEMFGVRSDMVRRRAGSEHWNDQRVAYQKRIVDVRTRQRAKALGHEAVEFDSRSLNLAKMGQAAVSMRLAEILKDGQDHAKRRAEAEQRRDQQGLPVDFRDFISPIDARELDSLSRAAQTFQLLGHKALGEDVTRVDVSGQVDVDATVEVVSVSQHLGGDDADRLASFLRAAFASGFVPEQLNNPDIVDADVIEEDEQ